MDNVKIAVIGQGYLSLPLTHTFSEKHDTIIIKGIVENPTWRL